MINILKDKFITTYKNYNFYCGFYNFFCLICRYIYNDNNKMGFLKCILHINEII